MKTLTKTLLVLFITSFTLAHNDDTNPCIKKEDFEKKVKKMFEGTWDEEYAQKAEFKDDTFITKNKKYLVRNYPISKESNAQLWKEYDLAAYLDPASYNYNGFYACYQSE